MTIQSIIAGRRDGSAHTEEEIAFLVRGTADGSIADYQLSAWLMAAYLNPLNEQETAWLTMAMANSGRRLDLTGLPKPWVDKHSTGGVGDKTSIVLLPMFAACGLTVVKMSGRGLGITGGTVDKLSSIRGFRLDLSPEELKDQAKRIGLALTGQTPDLAPADKVLYALRDATATVDSIPLIVSSILSKKLAGGAEAVVLDVKCGSGGFMPTLDRARELAGWLKRIGGMCGLNVRIAITDMSQPLGRTVGNALEIREALEILSPTNPSRMTKGAPSGAAPAARFKDLCIELCGLTLFACGKASSQVEAESMAAEALASGRAWEKAGAWFEAQGASGLLRDVAAALPSAPVQKTLSHLGQAGWVSRIDARTVGEVVVALGGGRTTKEAAIDLAVGIEVHVEIGDRIEQGQPLFIIHAASEKAADKVLEPLLGAVSVVANKVEPPPLILEVL